MIDYRWILIALNIVAALATVVRLQISERNRGFNGFLLGLNLMAAAWQTVNVLEDLS